jgi:hypothetical protein
LVVKTKEEFTLLIELITTAATFTVGLLQTGSDTHQRWFVLQTIGEMIFPAGSCYEPLVIIAPIFTNGS